MTETQNLAVLFVCLGNICRSPMAEAAFRHTVKESGYAESFTRIDSCGTAGYHVGVRPDSRTLATLKNNGIDTNHRARQVTKKDFDEFDYILAMDTANLHFLLRKAPPGSKAKVMLFGDFGNTKGEEVADPYYGGTSGFETNFKQIITFSKGFLRQVLGRE
ncbi:LMWPc-domain-containing protein [Terfezia boudieri ATCC MYA-4762]|uniref:LMWPc-domain-containing protein n=1 Tax=Terfezia boudieri ATCC MYA-4762 TaxID=1051890 RepID=A0A3N4M4I4_9PEZI|nr:LMWPc-domain-containing protein [Terfezia boudieri ATCC MYA-4762]